MGYVKGVMVVLFLVLFSSVVIADTFVLRNHEPIVVNGKTIELSGKGDEFVYVEVDGVFGKVGMEDLTEVNGVSLQALLVNEPYGDVPLSVEFIISVGFNCGDGECSDSEGSSVCCTDCGCGAGNTCVSNQCIKTELNECFADKECDDGKACTLGKCRGLPLKCEYTEITECGIEDGCCPEGCNTSLDYFNNDWDCLPAPECDTDWDCNDSNEDTIDLCGKRYRKCKFELWEAPGTVKEVVSSEEVVPPEEVTVEEVTAEIGLWEKFVGWLKGLFS